MITQSDPMVLEPISRTFPAKGASEEWKIGRSKVQSVTTQGTDRSKGLPETMAVYSLRNMTVRQTKPAFRFHKEATPRMKWHGFVTEIQDGGFWATFQNTEADKKAVVAEFDIEELADDDQKLLRIGAPLVWSIFTEREKGGLKNSSTLYVRRIAAPTREAVSKAKGKLDEWFADAGATSPAE